MLHVNYPGTCYESEIRVVSCWNSIRVKRLTSSAVVFWVQRRTSSAWGIEYCCPSPCMYIDRIIWYISTEIKAHSCNCKPVWQTVHQWMCNVVLLYHYILLVKRLFIEVHVNCSPERVCLQSARANLLTVVAHNEVGMFLGQMNWEGSSNLQRY